MERGFTVLLASMPAQVIAMFRREGLQATGGAVRVLSDFDRALEWSERWLFELERLVPPDAAVPIERMLAMVFPDPADRTLFKGHLTPYEFAAGDTLIVQGADSDDLLFFEAGRVEVWLELAGPRAVRLRAMEPGTVVGEIGFYLGLPRSASVVAAQPGRAYRLARAALEQIERKRPRLGTVFHQHMARLIAGKLNDTTTTLASLVR